MLPPDALRRLATLFVSAIAVSGYVAPKLLAQNVTIGPGDVVNWTTSETFSNGQIIYQTGGTLNATANVTLANIQTIGLSEYRADYRLSGGEATLEQLYLGLGGKVFQERFGSLFKIATGYLTVSGGNLVIRSELSVGLAIGYGQVSQSGGVVTTPIVRLTAGSPDSTLFFNDTYRTTGKYYLDGGVLQTRQIQKGNNNVGGATSALFYFNGGTLRATASNANFINNGITVLAGPGTAFIDSNGYDINLPTLRHDPDLGSTLDGGLTKQGSGTLTLSDGDSTHNGGTRIEGGVLQVGGGQAYGSVAGNVTVSAGATLAFNRSDNFAFSGVVSGAGSVEQRGTGTLTLNAANTHSGNTTITAGAIALAHPLALQNSTLVYPEPGGALGFGSLGAATLGGLSGAKSLALANASGQPLALSVGARSGAYSGQLSGPGSLTKIGPGTLTLSAAQNYAGATTVSGGTLALAAGGALPANSPLVVASEGTLDASGPVDTTVPSLSGAGALVVGNGVFTTTQSGDTTFSGPISGGGRLAMNGTGTLTLTGNNTFGSAAFANAGTIVFSSLNNLGQGLTFQFNGGTLRWAAGNTSDLSSRAVFINSGGAKIDTNGNHVVFANPIGTHASGQVGTGPLIKIGAGTLTLSGANTYTGDTQVNAGTLTLSATGTLAESSGIVISDGGTFDVSAHFDITLPRLSGAGHLILAANALTVDQSADTSFSGPISGLGRLLKAGSGTLTLTGANTYAGATFANGGVLVFSSGQNLGTSNIFQFGGGTLRWANGNTYDLSQRFIRINSTSTIDVGANHVTFANPVGSHLNGTIGAGGLIKAGSGTLTLLGANTYAGGTVVSAGTLRLGAGATLGTGRSLVISPGATLDVSAFGATGFTLPADCVVDNQGTILGVLQIAGADPRQNWRLLHFGRSDGLEESADTADPDDDGTPNLLEYAFGLDPLDPGSARPPAIVVSGGGAEAALVCDFTEPAGVAGLTYGAEWSATLAPGDWTPVPDIGSGTRHLFRVSLAGRPRAFLRLVVTPAP